MVSLKFLKNKQMGIEDYFMSIVDKQHLGQPDLAAASIRKFSKPQALDFVQWCESFNRTDNSVGLELHVSRCISLTKQIHGIKNLKTRGVQS